MRIVIDLQGAQSGSRFRGIGRYTLSLTKAMVRNRGPHEIILALNGLFPETLDSIFAEFKGLLPDENIRVWHAPRPVGSMDTSSQTRREISEKIREAFLADLHPDVVLVTSLFEGMVDDAIVSIGRLGQALPTAVILYDLIPLINPDIQFQNDKPTQAWYFDKIASLRRSQLLLAISENSRQDALTALKRDPDSIVTISGAYDEFFHVSHQAKSVKNHVWQKLGISKPFVMYIGAADERKNLKRLILAYAQLPNNVRQEHQLVFGGKMEGYVKNYQDFAKDAGLGQDEFIVTDYIQDSDVLTLYNTCSLFVFPSLHEGFGIPPLEAMACGAPVIGSDASSLKEVIGLKEALFDPTSTSAISAKMNQALTDENFRARLSAHGLQHCRSFSWDGSAKRALGALQRFDLQRQSAISPLLNIEKTSIFAPRRLKILVIKLDHLGDFLLAIPAFSKLKAKYPYATIDLIAGSWNIPIAKQLGFFDRIFAYNFFKQKSSERASLESEALQTLLEALDKYDIAIDFRRPAENRFLLVKVNAKLRVGYETFDPEINRVLDIALKAYREPSFIATPLNKTSVSRQILALVDAIPEDVNDFLTFPEISEKTQQQPGTIAIFPKAGTEAREWGIPNVLALVARFLDNPQVQAINIYFANQSDAEEFGPQTNSKVSLHIGLNFTELAASLSKNAICIANNSGGGHLASYLGVTTLGIYSGHELLYEWGLQFNDGYVIHRAVHCAPCHMGKKIDCPNNLICLEEISVEGVYDIAIDTLTRNSPDMKEKGPKVLTYKNTDTIVRSLIDSVADESYGLRDWDIGNLAEVISKNHRDYPLSRIPTILLPNVFNRHNSCLIDWIGFSASETEFRWTDSKNPEMRFICLPNQPSSGILEIIVSMTLGRQSIQAVLNGLRIYEGTIEGKTTLSIPVANIKNGPNRLLLYIPEAKIPGGGDERLLGFAVGGFTLYANSAGQEASHPQHEGNGSLN